MAYLATDNTDDAQKKAQQPSLAVAPAGDAAPASSGPSLAQPVAQPAQGTGSGFAELQGFLQGNAGQGAAMAQKAAGDLAAKSDDVLTKAEPVKAQFTTANDAMDKAGKTYSRTEYTKNTGTKDIYGDRAAYDAAYGDYQKAYQDMYGLKDQASSLANQWSVAKRYGYDALAPDGTTSLDAALARMYGGSAIADAASKYAPLLSGLGGYGATAGYSAPAAPAYTPADPVYKAPKLPAGPTASPYTYEQTTGQDVPDDPDSPEGRKARNLSGRTGGRR